MTEFLTLLMVFIALCLTFFRKRNYMDTYLIKKGKHNSIKNGLPFKFAFCGKRIKFAANFVEAEYDDTSLQDRTDINKLYGICFGIDPHKNSVRIGWTYDKVSRYIDLYAYAYVDGHRSWQRLGTIVRRARINCEIELMDNGSYSVIVRDYKHKMIGYSRIIANVKPGWFIRRMYPYFGGTSPAPNDIKIIIEDKKA